jgi:ATP-binding cassette subfamily F protein 3
VAKPARAARPRRSEKDVRKELKNVEKTIAQLDGQKRALDAQLLESSDAKESLRLHNEITALAAQLAPLEERWCELQEEAGEAA